MSWIQVQCFLSKRNVMAMLKKAFAGLALGTVIAGGMFALGAGAAVAAEGPGAVPAEHAHVDQDLWNRGHAAFYPQGHLWGSLFYRDTGDAKDAFGLAAKDIAVGFQEKANKNSWLGLSEWLNHHLWANAHERLNNHAHAKERVHPVR